MGEELGSLRLTLFLETVGSRLTTPTMLLLLGGGGLRLLGHERPTLDLDYDGDEDAEGELRQVLEQVAREMHIEIEAVPLSEFIPLPAGAEDRHIPVRTFGPLQVLVFDPYSIALSKLDRGFDADLEDVVFLLSQGFVDSATLEDMVDRAVESAAAFDLNPSEMRARLASSIQVSESG